MPTPTRPTLLALLVVGLATPTVDAQNTFTWNSSGTDWGTASNWSPAGPPTAADLARFTPGGAAVGASLHEPAVAGSQAAFSATFALNQYLGDWTVNGSGTLSLGAATSPGLQTYGPATYSINGPALQGHSGVALMNLTMGSGSTLALTGNTAVTANQGSVFINGGTLRLDNTSTNVPARLMNTGTLSINGNGVLDFIGNSAGTATNVGSLVVTDSTRGGTNVIRVTPNGGAAATLTFANSGNFSLRGGTRGVWRFEAGSGALGDATGGQIKFVGTPFVSGTNGAGLLANTATGATVGWATVSDSLGVNFATYTASAGLLSIANAASGVTITTLNDTFTGFGTGAAGNNQLNISNGTTVSASGNVTGVTLRVNPGTGSSINMGTNNLAVAALMLDGANDLTITGTGTFGIGGSRYIYVNNANATLSTSQVVTSNGNPVLFAGEGFKVLAGAGSQNVATDNTRLSIVAGVLRASHAQFNFVGNGTGGSATGGVIDLTGGVLEIAGGVNGTGDTADFRRPLGTAAGTVNWGGNTAFEIGSGGFSAFGSDASVNIAGAATPATMQWNQTNFVGDGYALRFGSPKSNAVLNWLNPINLENGTTYQLREINVTAGAGGDRTVLHGVISGATGVADLVKTGTGTLQLNAANTYAGNTLIHGGTLALGATGSIASSPNIILNAGTTLDVSAVAGGFSLASGQALRGAGTVQGALTAASGSVVAPGAAVLGALTLGGNTSFASGSAFQARLGSGATSDSLAVTGASTTLNFDTDSTLRLRSFGFTGQAGQFTLASLANGDNLKLDDATVTDGTPLGSYVQGTGPSGAVVIDVSGLGVSLATGDSFVLSRVGNNLVLTFSPVPEPGTVLALSAGSLGLIGLVRRVRRKRPPASLTSQ